MGLWGVVGLHHGVVGLWHCGVVGLGEGYGAVLWGWEVGGLHHRALGPWGFTMRLWG